MLNKRCCEERSSWLSASSFRRPASSLCHPITPPTPATTAYICHPRTRLQQERSATSWVIGLTFLPTATLTARSAASWVIILWHSSTVALTARSRLVGLSNNSYDFSHSHFDCKVRGQLGYPKNHWRSRQQVCPTVTLLSPFFCLVGWLVLCAWRAAVADAGSWQVVDMLWAYCGRSRRNLPLRVRPAAIQRHIPARHKRAHTPVVWCRSCSACSGNQQPGHVGKRARDPELSFEFLF